MEGAPAFARPTWAWSSDMSSTTDEGAATRTPSSSSDAPPPTATTDPPPTEKSADGQPSDQQRPRQPPPRYRRRYRARECRICKEVVEPTFHFGDGDDTGDAADGMAPTGPTLFGRNLGLGGPREPEVRYESEDPESGRLISPCKCKGTQKYVHEGCLQMWREAGGAASAAKYWECTTCRFRYRLGRLAWGRVISSWAARTALTLLILLLTIFLLGFVADPILGLWLGPLSGYVDDALPGEDLRDYVALDEDGEDEGWVFHFVKGIFSLGLLGFFKTFLAVTPWHWWNLRNTGIFGGGGGGGGRRGRGGTGRERLENINIAIVIVGVVTFLVAVWKGVSKLSAKALNSVSARVVDIHGDEPEEDEDEDEGVDGDGLGDRSRATGPPPADSGPESRKDI